MRSPTPATSAPIAERFSAWSAKGATGAGCGVGLAVGGCRNATSTPHELQAEPCRCSRRVASIIERIDLGYASDLMFVLVSLTAAFLQVCISFGVKK